MGMPIITPGTGTRSQAITDIIESVALEQTALSHILNAEGEKSQALVAKAITGDEILAVNSSVKSMVNSITMLELVLQSKLEMFDDCLCLPTPCTELTDTAITASNPKAIVTKNSMTNYKIDLTKTSGAGTLTITTTPSGLPISINGTLPTGLTLSGNVLSYTDWETFKGSTVKLNIGTDTCMRVLTIYFSSHGI
ncbi:MAG: hypothetical protein RSC41_03890 [Oscillospiraceae bacterium]